VIAYREFLRHLPVIDWERVRFELDMSRRVAFSSRPITWESRLYGLAFALRVRVPDPVTARFDRGFGRWCLPTRWHRIYHTSLVQAWRDRQASQAVSVTDTGGREVPGPRPPEFSRTQIARLRRYWKATKRAEARAALKGDTHE